MIPPCSLPLSLPFSPLLSCAVAPPKTKQNKKQCSSGQPATVDRTGYRPGTHVLLYFHPLFLFYSLPPARNSCSAQMRLMLMLPLPLPRPSSGGWLNNLRQFLDILSAANTHTHTYIETEPQTGPVYRNRTGYMRESSSSPRPAYVFHVCQHIFPFLVSFRFASIEVKTKLNPELYVPLHPFTSLLADSPCTAVIVLPIVTGVFPPKFPWLCVFDFESV